ncbi:MULTISPECIES: PLP-dependent aminotransferase family protein [Shewanella]|jgi:GntR family transcriptional regulator/MocR family aminotransferase|uniref:MocR-like pyridoxine biosynthesis transcription factor PdxR n=1 Tax=Shewanella TaxID=22 RepID=UPI000F50F821|nr:MULTISPECIES: PLP-dependent aminotransferase family protein [Shewanella]QHS15030.1 PLP-dependent aminotransferase family protein [Shewanella sp. Arc9-LZ]RPA64499.1 PLP-dependent aminotransferase family protein [Shewanella frigidimarina]
MEKRPNRKFAYKQVYQRIHSAILQGILKPGDRIPSARTLAKEMGVARGTVEEGYALLKAEGYIESKGQAGTLVSQDIQDPSTVKKAIATSRQPGFMSEIQVSDIMPFQLGIPALDAFPKQTWSRMTARCARNTHIDNLVYPSVYGIPELRVAIAQYLQLSRGVQCQPTQVFITSGYVNSLKWISKVLLQPESYIGVEDPGYPLTRRILENNHFNVIPVPVDEDGINIPNNDKIAAVIVTPAHQSPTCVSLSLNRRQMLLEWAETNQSWIVEDDYDGEYRHTGLPLPALKSLDTQDRVIYSGTFSKVLFPSLRMAYIVVPQKQVSNFEQCSELYAGNVSGLIQSSVLAFMQEGHLARHIQRMRKLYRERRELAARLFNQILGDRVSIEPQSGGMHMIVKLNDPKSDDMAIAEKMMKAGLFSQALSQWSSRPIHPSLILSFTNIRTEEECLKLISQLKDIGI